MGASVDSVPVPTHGDLHETARRLLNLKAHVKALQKEEIALKAELLQDLKATGQDRLELAEGTVERTTRTSWSPIDSQVLRRAIGEERAARYIHEEVESEMVVKELEPEVVAKIRHAYRETEFVEASPTRGLE
ncbi:MAG: hypothetical protein JRM86_05610 [Nitrososphaerota archaeon]|nr:hypothetical protein [Nitrososphaerota archaeon]